MQPTRAMLLECTAVMTNSHLIWGEIDDGPPPPPPEPVPNMMIRMTGNADGNGVFVQYELEPTNSAPDLLFVNEWIPSPGICFADGGTPLDLGNEYVEECTWQPVDQRWEFTHSGS